MGEHTTTSPPRTRSGVFPARPDQVREARKLISAALEGCPAAGDAILCISELAANSCLHSASRKTGGTFTVRTEIHEGDYVWIEVEDNGGPWDQHIRPDSRPHGPQSTAIMEVGGSGGPWAWGPGGPWGFWARLARGFALGPGRAQP